MIGEKLFKKNTGGNLYMSLLTLNEPASIDNMNFNSFIFPSTRYQGSKLKLAQWIGGECRDLNFTTVLDAFGGSGSVSYMYKKMGKEVTYNDILKFTIKLPGH